MDTVYDALVDPKTGKKTPRLMPSELDVQFALGSNVAGELLGPELDKFNYSYRLEELGEDDAQRIIWIR